MKVRGLPQNMISKPMGTSHMSAASMFDSDFDIDNIRVCGLP